MSRAADPVIELKPIPGEPHSFDIVYAIDPDVRCVRFRHRTSVNSWIEDENDTEPQPITTMPETRWRLREARLRALCPPWPPGGRPTCWWSTVRHAPHDLDYGLYVDHLVGQAFRDRKCRRGRSEIGRSPEGVTVLELRNVVPEPSRPVMLAAGALMLAGRRWMRRP